MIRIQNREIDDERDEIERSKGTEVIRWRDEDEFVTDLPEEI